MRTGLIATGLLALALQGCGGGGTTTSGAPPAPGQHTSANIASGGAAGAVAAAVPAKASGGSAGTATASTAATSGTATTSSAATGAPAAASAFVPATSPGHAPAALLVGARDGAVLRDAQALAKLGVASIAVADARSLGALRVALATLRARPDVDPARIGVVAEGAGATLAAKLVAREPMIGAAVLGDATAAAAAPLRQLDTTHVLFQRGADSGAATKDARERLVAAAPPGALLYEHPSLGDAGAQRERDAWLRAQLAG